MKVLVTGGAGFIGSHLAQALCRRGAKVVVWDNLSLGSLANLAWKQSGDDLDFVQGDVADVELGRQLVPGCDWVFHQAALPSVPLSVAQPWETNRENLDAALQLLILARDAGIKRFLFASSSAVYGDSDVSPKAEDHPPDPLSPYALQKFAAERYAQFFSRYYRLPTVSLRYFNVFGPRQSFDSPYSGVIARFCTNVLQGQAPRIFGDGLQSRDFVYVTDVVEANLRAAEAPAERVAGGVYNVGCGRSLNLRQLAETLNELTGQNLTPVFEPARAGDVRASQAEISAAREFLGYEPRVSWRAGLEATLGFYRDQSGPAPT
jgi:UDP-glucose 4-epimerase